MIPRIMVIPDWWTAELEEAATYQHRRSKKLSSDLAAALKGTSGMPHLNLLAVDLKLLVQIAKREGQLAMSAELDRLHKELFVDPEFRQELTNRWKQSERWRVLSQILSAHDAGLYAAAVPTAMAQAEGLLVSIIGKKARTKEKDLKRLLDRPNTFFGPTASNFFEVVTDVFTPGHPLPAFSRHAILHGEDVHYGTEANSLRVILWIDYIFMALMEEKPPSREGDQEGEKNESVEASASDSLPEHVTHTEADQDNDHRVESMRGGDCT